MNEDGLQPGALPPVASPASFWSAHRRRPTFLLLLVAGLVLTLLWLPAAARASLWAVVRAQRGLVILLSLFALVTLSLIWSAGQRLDARVFVFLNLRRYPAWLDRGMWLATQLGSMLAAATAALLLYVLHYQRLAIEIVIGTLTLWLLVLVLLGTMLSLILGIAVIAWWMSFKPPARTLLISITDDRKEFATVPPVPMLEQDELFAATHLGEYGCADDRVGSATLAAVLHAPPQPSMAGANRSFVTALAPSSARAPRPSTRATRPSLASRPFCASNPS